MNTLSAKINTYLRDPLLSHLWQAIRKAGPLRAISVDLTHLCNLRCKGCYFFAEDMDHYASPADETAFQELLVNERERGTNFITVVGGEPSLALGRLKQLHDQFALMVVTNGLRRIPREGFEKLALAVSVWGDAATDRAVRGGGRVDVFRQARANYRDDDRVVWYYTTSPGKADEIHRVVQACIENGNFIAFNYYGDISRVGGDFDHRVGFGQVRAEIDRMIELYPDRILFSSYINNVITTGRLNGRTWGYNVCSSITFDHELNQQRIRNGNPYNPHFRAYYPDFRTTRRCCVGEARDCTNCFDVWAHMSWIMLHLEEHLATAEDFRNYVTAVYLFYLATRLVDFDEGVRLLPEIHRRPSGQAGTAEAREVRPLASTPED